MQIAQLEIPYHSRLKAFHLYLVGDAHQGSALCDEDKFQSTIDEIGHDPDAIVFLMGDLAEFIAKDDWRFEDDNIAEWVSRSDVGYCQEERLIKLLRPIRKKIFGAIQGNHEFVLEREWNNAVHSHICDRLEIRNLGYMAMVRLQFTWRRGKGRGNGDYRPLDILLHHGYGGGRTDGADINRFNELMRDYNCDIVVCGHTHRRLAIKSVQHYIGLNGTLGERVRMACRSGTFMKTIAQNKSGYAEKSAMRPLVTGALMITYHPDKSDFIANV